MTVDALRDIAAKLPSAVNSQSTRWVVVSGEKNTALWDLIDETQKGVLPDEAYAFFSTVFQQAKNGVGTILLFESREAVTSMPVSPERAELYKENNHGIASFATWLLLTELGLGTSLQHFNVGYEQGYDKSVRELLGLSDDWEMLAQMPFGSIETPADDKPKMSAEDRVIRVD